jgi:hypothetical protein
VAGACAVAVALLPGGREAGAVTAAAPSGPCAVTGPYAPPAPGSAGLPAGTALCPTGPLVVAVPGAVLDGWDVRGGLVVTAPDVLVRRSRVTGDGSTPFGLVTAGGGSVRVEDATFTGDFPAAALAGPGWTAQRVLVTGATGDGARLGAGSRLRNSELRNFAPDAGAAARAVVVEGGDALVEDNRVELGDGPDRASAVLLAPAPGGGAVVVRGNELGGGRYVLHQVPAADGAEVVVSGNRIRRPADPGARPLRVGRGAVVEGNTWRDGGLLPVG